MSFDREGNDLKIFKKDYKVFIETGSENGWGINAALIAGFDTIYSIELDPKYYNICKERFKDNPNVNLILGSSETELPKLLETINEPFFMWLDAHWSAAGYMGEMMHDFLPKELDVLLNHKDKFKNSSLGIDDFNHYLHNKTFCSNMENKVKELNPNWNVHYYNSPYEGQIFLMGE